MSRKIEQNEDLTSSSLFLSRVCLSAPFPSARHTGAESAEGRGRVARAIHISCAITYVNLSHSLVSMRMCLCLCVWWYAYTYTHVTQDRESAARNWRHARTPDFEAMLPLHPVQRDMPAVSLSLLCSFIRTPGNRHETRLREEVQRTCLGLFWAEREGRACTLIGLGVDQVASYGWPLRVCRIIIHAPARERV